MVYGVILKKGIKESNVGWTDFIPIGSISALTKPKIVCNVFGDITIFCPKTTISIRIRNKEHLRIQIYHLNKRKPSLGLAHNISHWKLTLNHKP